MSVVRLPKSIREAMRPTIGLPCPKCGCCDTRVYYTRRRPKQIMRRRECRACGKRFTTREE